MKAKKNKWIGVQEDGDDLMTAHEEKNPEEEVDDAEEKNYGDSPFNIDKNKPKDPLLEIYFKEIRKYKILTRDQEVQIFQRLELCKKNNVGSIDPEEAKRWEEESATTKNKIAAANLALVVSQAKTFRVSSNSLNAADLIQEGNIGLMKAVDKFDWRLGFKFSTYAVPWIRQTITRAIEEKRQTIRSPTHHQQRIKILNRAEKKIKQNGEEITIETLSKETGLSHKQIRGVNERAGKTISMSTLLTEYDDGDLEDMIDDVKVVSPETRAEENELLNVINEVVETLPTARERIIIRQRFGLEDGRERTLGEIGQEFKLSRERIRQIEEKILTKLRNPARAKKLKGFLEK